MKPAGPSRDLVLVLALAAAVRLVRVFAFAPVVEGDGAEYARIAENLLAGSGYVGLLAGPERMLPPLYPVAIAAASALTGLDAPASGRFVSLLAGLVTVAALQALGARLFGRLAGIAAGLLAAILPSFVLAGSAVFAESLQLALLSCGLLALLRARETPAAAHGLGAGLLFGLAALARVESLALGVWAAVLLVVAGPPAPFRRRAVLVPAAAMLLGIGVAVLPYAAYLHGVTGSWRVEAKAERVAATIARYARGLDYGEANYALGPAGEELGPWLSPNADPPAAGLRSAIGADPGAFLGHYAANLKRIAWMLVSGHTVWSVLVLGAFALALAAPGRNAEARLVAAFLAGAAAYAILLGALYKVVLRYLFVLALPAAVFGARGIVEAARRFAPRWPARRPELSAVVLALLLAASTARGVFTGFAEFDEASPAQLAVRALGLRLRSEPDAGAVMGDDPRVAYYAGRTWHPLPVAASWEIVEARARRLDIRFLNVRRPPGGRAPERPGPWFDFDRPPGSLVPIETRQGHALFRLRPE